MKNIYILIFFLIGVSVFGQIPLVEEIKLSPNSFFEKVFDQQGNSYQLKDLQVGKEKKINNSLSRSVAITCNTGIFELYFETDSGMEDTTNPLHNARRAVVCQVYNDLSNFIVTPLKDAGNSTKVKIWVRNIKNLLNVPPNALGLATSFYTMPYNTNANFGGIIDNEIWKTITLGKDSFINVASPITNTSNYQTSSGNFYHGMMAFNFNTVSWNTNLSMNAPALEFDLYSVILHEVTHALGFASLINAEGKSVFGIGYNYFSRYDALLKNNNGTQKIISNTDTCSMYNYNFNSTLNTSILHPSANNCVSDQTTCSTAIKFFGPTITSTVYNPNCFEQGSSISHFEDQCITAPNQGNNTYFTMSNLLSTGSSKRFLKPEERKALSDIGYKLNTTFGNNTTTLNSFNNYDGNITTGNIVAGMNDGINTENGIFNFVGNINSPINLINLLGNDKNAVGFECLQDVFDSSALISETSGNNLTNPVFSSTINGLHLLRYIPISASGQKGNITYVYVYLYTQNNCTTNINSSDLIINGNFENITSPPTSIGQFNKICNWYSNALYSSVDLFSSSSNINFYKVPCNYIGYENDMQSENTYGGMAIIRNYSGNMTYSEIIKTKLSTPLLPNSNYNLSFYVSMAESTSTTAIKFQAYLSKQDLMTTSHNILLPISNSNMLFENQNYSLQSNGWQKVNITFSTGEIAGEEYLYIGGLNNIQYSGSLNPSIIPDCTSSNNNNLINAQLGYCYYFIDNISLIPLYGGSLNLPNEVCSSTIITNLSNYLIALPTNGVFSGNGVENTGGIYSFNPYIAGISNSMITYTYTNNNGSVVSISDTINVVNNGIIPTFNTISPLCAGATTPSLPTTSTNGISGTWSPLQVSNTTTTTYTFTPNPGQCASITTLTISVLPINNPACITDTCLPNITLNVPETNNIIVYKKTNWIETNTNYTTLSTQNISMKAGDFINFKPGTTIATGTALIAKIEVCTSNSRIIRNKEEKLEELNNELTIYPNPTHDVFTISSTLNLKSVKIYSIDGKEILNNENINTNKIDINLRNFNIGIYLAYILNSNDEIISKKIIKN